MRSARSVLQLDRYGTYVTEEVPIRLDLLPRGRKQQVAVQRVAWLLLYKRRFGLWS